MSGNIKHSPSATGDKVRSSIGVGQITSRQFANAVEVSEDCIPASLYQNSKIAETSSSDALSTKYAMDDSIINRPHGFDPNQSSTMTVPKTSNKKVYICPSNSFVASNGEVYQIEPFMLPPPSEIAELMNLMRERGDSSVGLRRDRGDSNLGITESKITNPENASLERALSEGAASPIVSRRLATMTPFSPATLSTSVEWMGPGKPKSILHLTPANINTNLSNSSNTLGNIAENVHENRGDSLQQRRGSTRNSYSNSEYRVRTASAPEFTSVSSNMLDNASGNQSPQSPSHRNNALDYLSDSSYANDNQQNNSTAVNGSTTASTSLADARERFIDAYAKQSPPSDGEYFHLRKFSLLKYLKVEMFGVGESEKGERRGSDNIANFLTVPFKIERMVWFGFFVCLDAFWYTVTYLPVRVIYSLYLLCKEIIATLVFPFLNRKEKEVRTTSRYFHRTHAYDLMVGALMMFGVYALQMLNMGRVYHYIRGQNMIKLYVLTGMLEIFDKLLSSFGQDAFDSLYWRTRRYDGAETGKIAFSFIVVAFYVMLHSGIYFIHIATLTVAINSAEQALITVLILNNFAEIKSFVFKKFDKQNLFQLACSDITERFQLSLFLTIITAVAFAQSGSIEAGWKDVFPSHCFVILVMIAGESVADWIKHAFISKFNFIDASVYDDFMRVLRKDILNSQKDKVILNHTYAITRRVGLSQIPLGCVAVRYMNLAFSSVNVKVAYSALPIARRLYLGAAIFGSMVLFKIFIGIALVVVSGFEHNRELSAKAVKLQQLADNGKVPLVKRESLAQLSNIERYTVYRGKVLG